MDDRMEIEEVQQVSGDRACDPKASRTLVIVLSQVVVIVALAVLWSVLRGRRSSE
jgi:hypothetical protein